MTKFFLQPFTSTINAELQDIAQKTFGKSSKYDNMAKYQLSGESKYLELVVLETKAWELLQMLKSDDQLTSDEEYDARRQFQEILQKINGLVCHGQPYRIY